VAGDSRHNPIRTVDSLGIVVEHVYDGINRRIEERIELGELGIGGGALALAPGNPDGLISSRWAWDGNSRLVSISDDRGSTTRFGYDALDRRISQQYADGSLHSWTYDRDDNVVQEIDPNASVFETSYDAANRPLRTEVERASGVAGSTFWEFQYDGLSRLTQTSTDNDPTDRADDSTVERRYDSLDRLIREIQNGLPVERLVDGVGNPVQITYPNGRRVGYQYDGIDRIERISDTDLIAQYEYIGPSRVLERTYGNSSRLVRSSESGQPFAFDGLRRLLVQQHELPNGSLIERSDYGYDAVGNVRFELNASQASADIYSYDSAYRLEKTVYGATGSQILGIPNNEATNVQTAPAEGRDTTQYAYDGAGNRLPRTRSGEQLNDTTSYSASGLNQYAEVDGVERSHDGNGNLTSDGDLDYTFNARNQLISVTSSFTGIESQLARYSYDALGRRIRKATESGATLFFYDQDRVIEERVEGDDGFARQFVYGDFIDDVLEMRTPSGRFFYHNVNDHEEVQRTDRVAGQCSV